jgi:hypothetical protein
VNPKLVNEVDRIASHVHCGLDAEQRERHMKWNDGQRFEGRLSQRDRKVQIFALVVHRVDGPEHVDDVARAMPPVVDEVDAHEPDDPRKGASLGEGHPTVLVNRRVRRETYQLQKHVDDLRGDSYIEVGDGRPQAINTRPPPPTNEHLYRNRHEEDRHRIADEVRHRRVVLGDVS